MHCSDARDEYVRHFTGGEFVTGQVRPFRGGFGGFGGPQGCSREALHWRRFRDRAGAFTRAFGGLPGDGGRASGTSPGGEFAPGQVRPFWSLGGFAKGLVAHVLVHETG